MTARLKSIARCIWVLALVALATFLTSVKFGSPETGIDDANIFLAYARNFSAGYGFVFNPGGERVEGFTSLLWVLVASAATTIAAHPERILLALNVALVSLTVLRCLRELPDVWAIAFVLVLLSDVSYVAWHTVTLMETALWGTLVTTAVLISSSERAGRHDALLLGAIATLLVLTRPEALLWVPVLVGFFYVSRSSKMGHSEASRQIAPAVAAFVLTAGILTLFRLGYFGFPLPNTYYAKVPPSLDYTLREGLKYVKSYVKSSPIVFAGVLAILASMLHLVNTRFRDTKTFALTAAAGTGLAIPVLIGGDHFDGFRFYQPIYPILLLTLVNCLRRVVPQYIPVRVKSSAGTRLKLLATSVGFGLCVMWQAVAWISFDRSAVLGREFDLANTGRRVGDRANAVFGGLHPLPDVATITVGGLKYAYRGPVTDLMGLNDTRMAHNGGDRIGVRSHAAFEAQTFYALKPKIVLPLVNHSGSLATVEHQDAFARLVLKGLLDQPTFANSYQLAEVRTQTSAGVVALPAWYERRFLAELNRSGRFEIIAKASR